MGRYALSRDRRCMRAPDDLVGGLRCELCSFVDCEAGVTSPGLVRPSASAISLRVAGLAALK
jgi:hypothetical protein